MKRATIAAGVVAVVLIAAGALALEAAAPLFVDDEDAAQRFGRRRRGFMGSYSGMPDLPIDNFPYSGKWTFNRIRFNNGYYGRGGYEWGLDLGWNHDYPRAENNLGQMFEALTTLPTQQGGGNVLKFTEPDFFRHPWAYLSEPGYWAITDEEAESLRAYLLKGGFLVVDDMSGNDLYSFMESLRRALPGAEYQILDTTHDLFNVFFEITQADILNQWSRSQYGGQPVILGVYEDNDPSKRLMVVINQNQDIGESWEFSNTGYVPVEQANNSYKLGINYVIYSLLH